MKTTRKTLPLICLMMAVMLLMASCNLSFIPGLNPDTTTPAPQTTETTPQTGTSNNPPQETPIDISKIPESKGLAYVTFDEGFCAIIGIGTCRDSVVRIPEMIDGYRVTDLFLLDEGGGLEESIEQNNQVTTIIIPKTVTKIHRDALVCVKLSTIVVDPDNPIYYSEGNCVMERISKTLILGCNGSVIPKNVTRIGDYAFAFCYNLKALTIHAGITSIGESAFWYCRALDDITFEGTKAEWSSLITFDPMDLYIGEFCTIHCTDGDIVIEGGDSTCEHSFQSDCAEYCKNCDGGYREADADHSYISNCDEYCDVCGGGYRSTDANHQPDLDIIGGIRCLICGDNIIWPMCAPSPCSSCGHTPDRSCDTICDNCGAELPDAHHEYSTLDDVSCYYCGEIRSLD